MFRLLQTVSMQVLVGYFALRGYAVRRGMKPLSPIATFNGYSYTLIYQLPPSVN